MTMPIRLLQALVLAVLMPTIAVAANFNGLNSIADMEYELILKEGTYVIDTTHNDQLLRLIVKVSNPNGDFGVQRRIRISTSQSRNLNNLYPIINFERFLPSINGDENIHGRNIQALVETINGLEQVDGTVRNVDGKYEIHLSPSAQLDDVRIGIENGYISSLLIKSGGKKIVNVKSSETTSEQRLDISKVIVELPYQLTIGDYKLISSNGKSGKQVQVIDVTGEGGLSKDIKIYNESGNLSASLTLNPSETDGLTYVLTSGRTKKEGIADINVRGEFVTMSFGNELSLELNSHGHIVGMKQKNRNFMFSCSRAFVAK